MFDWMFCGISQLKYITCHMTTQRLGILFLSFILAKINTLSNTNSGEVFTNSNNTVNDDYCDAGNDELSTSACSYYSTNQYFCLVNDDLKLISTTQIIPLSRINDGVCDCCDGKDEINNLFINPKCEGICYSVPELVTSESSMLLRNDDDDVSLCNESVGETYPQAKIDTKSEISFNDNESLIDSPSYSDQQYYSTLLLQYYTLQQGLQAKRYAYDNFLLEQSKQKLADNRYQSQLLLIATTMKKLNTYYNEEVKREHIERLSLLRERLYNCAIGFQTSCHVFSSQWLTEDTYPFDLESISHSYLSGDSLTPSQHSLRVHNTSVCLSRNIHRNLITGSNSSVSGSESKFSRSKALLEGLDRVMESCCLHSQIIPNLQRNQLFITIFHYMKEKSLRDKQRKESSSSQIINGYKIPQVESYNVAELRVSSTLFGRFLNRRQRGYREGLVYIMQLLALPFVPFVALFQYAIYPFIISPAMALWSESVIAWLFQYESAQTQYSLIAPYTKYIYYWCLQNLDYRRSSLLMTALSHAHPATLAYTVFKSIVYRYPDYLYAYYFTSQFDALPQGHSVCLLRAGLKYAAEEHASMQMKITQSEEVQRQTKYFVQRIMTNNYLDKVPATYHQLAMKYFDYLSLHPERYTRVQEKYTQWRTASLCRLSEASGSEATDSSSTSYIDYGVHNEWWLLRDTCMHSTDTQSGDAYTLCPFQNVSINGQLTHQFLGWGSYRDVASAVAELDISSEMHTINQNHSHLVDDTNHSSSSPRHNYSTSSLLAYLFTYLSPTTYRHMLKEMIYHRHSLLAASISQLQSYLSSCESPLMQRLHDAIATALHYAEDHWLISSQRERGLKYRRLQSASAFEQPVAIAVTAKTESTEAETMNTIDRSHSTDYFKYQVYTHVQQSAFISSAVVEVAFVCGEATKIAEIRHHLDHVVESALTATADNKAFSVSVAADAAAAEALVEAESEVAKEGSVSVSVSVVSLTVSTPMKCTEREMQELRKRLKQFNLLYD